MIKGIKICGVSDFETLKFIVNHPYPPDYIGFITNYEKSKRFVDYEKLKELLKIKRQNISFVSVMVKPNNEFLKKIENLNFDYYQLYDVSPDRIKTIRNMKPIKIISALTINEKKDVLNKSTWYSLFVMIPLALLLSYYFKGFGLAVALLMSEFISFIIHTILLSKTKLNAK